MVNGSGHSTVLITGGAGFIGANLCRRLVASEWCSRVLVLDDLSSGTAANLAGLEVELVEASLLDEVVVTKVVAQADAVVHLGARGSVPRSIADPLTTFRINVTGTLNVLEAARHTGLPQVIFASSSSVYGANPVLPKSEDLAPRPMSPYAASKLSAESTVLAYGASYDLNVVPFRFFNVFGPLQPANHVYAAVIPRFVAAALKHEALTIFGDGLQSRDFTYVSTVVDVIERALITDLSTAEPLNLAFGNNITLLEVVAMLEKELGRPLRVNHEEPRLSDVRHSQADNTRLCRYFPDLAPVDLAQGLACTVAWMRDQVPTPP